MEKILLDVTEFCDYLGIGKTKAREILARKNCSFKIKIGNRTYAHKPTLDKHLSDCMKYGIPV